MLKLYKDNIHISNLDKNYILRSSGFVREKIVKIMKIIIWTIMILSIGESIY